MCAIKKYKKIVLKHFYLNLAYLCYQITIKGLIYLVDLNFNFIIIIIYFIILLFDIQTLILEEQHLATYKQCYRYGLNLHI